MNIDSIQNGVVIDHITAGSGMRLYDLLGLDRTEEGAVVGWILTKNNPDSFVDFGLDSMPDEERRRFLSADRNEDIKIWLHFNPDGLIYNMIDKINR